ncbi:hypothetical protein GJAV_G00042680 [Gymnothorax javanicus]|nr:hypothetical protein GJAV_G00042680 [Gymnothorax javanicus]
MSERKRGKEGKKSGNKKGKKDKTETPTLTVTGPPAVPKLKPMKSVEMEDGKKNSLKCEARIGNPVPKFKWYKDGKEFSGKNKPKDVKIKKRKGIYVCAPAFCRGMISELLFRKGKESHSGVYICEAINDLGKDQITANLTVIKSKSTS